MDLKTDIAGQSAYVSQFSVFLINRAGALLSVVRLLEAANVLVLGMSLQDSEDVTIARLIVSDPETVETLFQERGIPYGTCPLLLVQLKEGPEDISRCLTAFLMAETNIHFSYPLLVRPNSLPVLAFHLEDIDFGASVMETHGFRILRQKDISR